MVIHRCRHCLVCTGESLSLFLAILQWPEALPYTARLVIGGVVDLLLGSRNQPCDVAP